MTSGLLKTLLFGFRPLYILTAAAVSLVPSVSPRSPVPARRASHIDPMVALRQSHETPNGQEYSKDKPAWAR